MALKIRTTGIEQYAPGGDAVLKMMIIGGPSAGKTRMSSYWPKPIYADCEGGLGSVADRTVPFVSINSSQDMLDFLAHMKLECRRPFADREFQTVVIDTLDAFHRKIKDEWLLQNPGAGAFRGFDAWGYLETKMQMLLTRLLNLNCNIIVNCHYKDKTIREGTGDNASERQELMLQLQGDVKDSVFNDFDLVGWLGTYWDLENGVRVEKRGLTFKKTPDKPFLKDRLFITPPWMEITFSDEDYAQLFGAFTARLDSLADSGDLGEIASEIPEVVRPTGAGSGPLPPMNPADMPLAQLDKPTLQNRARELGIAFKGNTLKGELIALVEAKLAEIADATPASPDTPVEQPAEMSVTVAVPTAPADSAGRHMVTASNEPTYVLEPAQAEPALDEAQSVAAEPPAEATGGEGVTDISHLTEVEPTLDEAVELIENTLDGEVISVTEDVDGPTMTPGPEPVAATVPPPIAEASTSCERCGEDVSGGNQDYVKIGKIKFRLVLCNEHFTEAKAAPNAPWVKELQGAHQVSA